MIAEPIRKVLMNPILLLGCEGSLLIFSQGALVYTITQGVIRGSSLWEYFLVALLVMAMPMVLVGLRSLAEIDPQYTEIYLQSRKYPKIIRAVDTPFAERRFRK